MATAPPGDEGWEVEFGEDEARAFALLSLANDSSWVLAEPGKESRVPLADEELELAVRDWLAAQAGDGEHGVLYWRLIDDETGARLPVVTRTAHELDRLVPDVGPLWQALSARVPLDAWLLEGEAVDEVFVDFFSQSTVWLGLYPRGPVGPRTRLAIGLYQALALAEGLSGGPIFGAFSRSLSLSLRAALERAAIALGDADLDRLALALETFGYRFAALDWFDEQAEDPDLMRRRGLCPGEPLPRAGSVPELDLYQGSKFISVDKKADRDIVHFSNLEKQIVFRTNRFIRVRRVKCFRSIFWVSVLPPTCCSGGK